MQLQEIKTEKLTWTNITNPDEGIVFLKEKYKFHPLDIEDCLSRSQRANIDIYPKYIFMVLLFPVYVHTGREIKAAELDFFIGKDYLITIHNNHLTQIKEIFHLCSINEEIRQKNFITPENLLYEILNKLLTSCYPMLDHIDEDVDNIERKIFKGYEKEMVGEISITRRNITDFRKIMQSHKKALQKLITGLKVSDQYVMKKEDVYYDNLIDHTKEIWDVLENLKERIEALQQTNESLISFRINDIIKVLTVISVIILPISLIANLFGMNFELMPLANHPLGFWTIIAIIIATVLILAWYFKKKKWL